MMLFVRSPRVRMIILVCGLICCNLGVLSFPLQTALSLQKSTAAFSGLGEFRPVLADYVIIAADYHWHQGRWYVIPSLYSFIVRLEPEYREHWSLLGWFYAFTVSSYAASADKRTEAIERGIDVLRNGLIYHPHTAALYFDIAWIYYKKCADYERAIRYLERARQREHSFSVDRLAALTYARLGRRDDAIAVWSQYLTQHPNDRRAHDEMDRLTTAFPAAHT